MRIAAVAALLLAVASSAYGQDSPKPTHDGRRAADWLVELRDGDVAARRKAIFALWKLGPAALAGEEGDVREIAGALTDEEDYVADVAGRILIREASAARTAADAAVAALEDSRPAVRATAVRVIRAGLPESMHAAGSLLSRLADEDPTVRRETVTTFGLMGGALGGSGFAGQVIAGLTGCLEDDDAGVRREAAFALTAFGAGALSAVPALVRCLSDASASVRAYAANALWLLGPAAGARALDGLYSVLADESADVRALAYGGIDAVGPDDARLFDAMRRGMVDGDARVRRTASWVLGQRYGDRAGVREMLLSAARDPYSLVRVNALLGLARARPVPRAALEALASGVRDEDPQVRSTAARSVGEIGPDARYLVPALIGMLRDTESFNDQVATIALGRIGVDAREALPDLRRRWARLRDPRERGTAGAALARVSPLDRDAVLEEVIAVLRGESAAMPRFVAAQAAGEIGSAAAPAVPALRSVLRSDDALAQMSALVALGQIGTAAAEALPDVESLHSHAMQGIARRAKEASEAIRRAMGSGR